MLGDKFRFRFAKTGSLRLLSHHDLMRCLERMLRRAALPFKSTAGFHPTPRVVFALSLPLGVAGLNEVLEIEFTRPCDPADVLACLRTQAPLGLTFTQATAVPLKATAIPRRIEYRLPLPADRVSAAASRCAQLLAQDNVWVDRLKPSPKQLDIRPYLRKLETRNSDRGTDQIENSEPGDRNSKDFFIPSSELPVPGSEQVYLCMDLWVTQTGTARADELLELLEVADLVDAGAVIERTTVEIRDEVTTPMSADGPPEGPAATRPLDPAAAAARSRRAAEQTAGAAWDVMPAGPVVE